MTVFGPQPAALSTSAASLVHFAGKELSSTAPFGPSPPRSGFLALSSTTGLPLRSCELSFCLAPRLIDDTVPLGLRLRLPYHTSLSLRSVAA